MEYKEGDFLSVQHYVRYLIAEKLKTNVRKIDEYVYYEVGELDEFFPVNFVLGKDSSTGKLFVMPVRRRCHIPDGFPEEAKARLRRCMGFDYHAYEDFKFTRGIGIRLQGDLVMEVREVFEDEREVLSFLSPSNFPDLFNSYVRERLKDNKEVAEVERLGSLYVELMDYVLRSTLPKEKERAVMRLLRKVEKELTSRFDFEVVNVYERKRSVFHRSEKCIRFIDVQGALENFRRRKVTREDFVDYVKSRTQGLAIKLGHYTTPHLIRLKGVLVNAEVNLAGVIMFGPQAVYLSHPEHGEEAYYVPKPSYVLFRLMGMEPELEAFLW
ncbi:MAG: hypothetical protein MPF33_02200 [Candidatus Aramenus sp.]|jgi:hypothetical protein|nr:hypothetical protein [Candidatus Aramenus sp.]